MDAEAHTKDHFFWKGLDSEDGADLLQGLSLMLESLTARGHPEQMEGLYTLLWWAPTAPLGQHAFARAAPTAAPACAPRLHYLKGEWHRASDGLRYLYTTLGVHLALP